MISCGARLAPFDIAELREIMSYDEMELDKIGDRKTALFLIMSDTDTTFNFVIAMLQSQLFNLLCDKADDEYGGRLPVHVRVIADEFANIGQIPQFIFLFLIMFMIVITYFYYKLFFREIIIKSLYGYPFIYIYKSLFRTNMLVNIGVLPFIVIVYKRLPLYMVVILGWLLLIDYFMVRIVSKYLLAKGEAQFIRGEFK